MNIGQNVINDIEYEIQEALLAGQFREITLTADDVLAFADGINSFLLERFLDFKVEYIKHMSGSVIFVSRTGNDDCILRIHIVPRARSGVCGQDYSRLLTFRRAHTPNKLLT